MIDFGWLHLLECDATQGTHHVKHEREFFTPIVKLSATNDDHLMIIQIIGIGKVKAQAGDRRRSGTLGSVAVAG